MTGNADYDVLSANDKASRCSDGPGAQCANREFIANKLIHTRFVVGSHFAPGCFAKREPEGKCPGSSMRIPHSLGRA